MNKEDRIRYYSSFDDDFFGTYEKYELPENYKWVRKGLHHRILSGFIYFLALVFSNIYCRLFLHVKIKGADKVRTEKSGFFLYGNHTQPIGDVFNPALACFPKRIYTVVSVANFALPIIGKILYYLGALPIPDKLQKMSEFNKAIEYRLKNNNPIIIYPEAHLWEYYTHIRPFATTSFKYPVKLGVPVYCITTTYQKRRWGKKPAITLYIDGPFESAEGTVKDKAQKLRDDVYECMKQRSRLSNYSYIKYKKK